MDNIRYEKTYNRITQFTETPSVLVERQKHGNRYYFLYVIEDLEEWALKILTERHEEGYWYEKPEPPDSSNNLSTEEIQKLPPKLQAEATKLNQRYILENNAYIDELSEYNDIVEAIKTKNGKAAWVILNNRSGGEYENIDIYPIEMLEDK